METALSQVRGNRQALFILAWYRDKADIPRLGAGFGLSQATSYRYVAEGTKVVSAEAPAWKRRWSAR